MPIPTMTRPTMICAKLYDPLCIRTYTNHAWKGRAINQVGSKKPPANTSIGRLHVLCRQHLDEEPDDEDDAAHGEGLDAAEAVAEEAGVHGPDDTEKVDGPHVEAELPLGPPQVLLHQQRGAAHGADVVAQVAAVEAGAGRQDVAEHL